MAAPDGKLTPEEIAKISVWLSQRKRLHCPSCGQQNWMIGERLVQPLTLDGNRALMLGGGIGYPQVMHICRSCGHTMFYNAVVMGLVPAAPGG